MAVEMTAPRLAYIEKTNRQHAITAELMYD
jgi:hypothetical protein